MSRAAELVKTAIALAFRGMWVFPVRGKLPTTEHGFLDAVTAPNLDDADAVRDLFAQQPSATGIGVDCGRSGLLVVDLDGPQAEEAWKDRQLQHGEVETLAVATGRPDGGRHLWFSTRDARARNSTKKIGAGIDTRGRGGYVIAPPSAHPSGTRYQWLPGLSTFAPAPIVAAPEWILEMIAPPPVPPAVGERRSLRPGESLTAYGRAALDGLEDKMLSAVEGTRNETLLECSRRAGRLEAAGEIEAALAENVIIQAALTAGLSQDEIEKTFRSGFEFGRQYPAIKAAR